MNAKQILQRTVNKAIANGSPIVHEITPASAMLSEMVETVKDMEGWDGSPEAFETMKENLRAAIFRAKSAGIR